MMTIDAIGRDGASILPDLQHSSPTGGLCQSETRNRATLTPGDVMSAGGAWAVVADVRHNGLLGHTTAGLILADGSTVVRQLWATDCAYVRTDCRIDPDTLWRLTFETVTA